MANGLVKELTDLAPRDAAAELPSKDVRAAQRMLRSPLLRFETARRLARIGTLCALDVAALLLAIGSAAVVRSLLLGHVEFHKAFEQTKQYAPIACLVTILLFALAGLYGHRAVRPGFARIVAALFQVTLVVLGYTIVQGQHFASYYIFYGSLFFAVLYVTLFRVVFDRVTGAILRAAGYHRRTVLVGTGSQIDAVVHALAEGTHSEIEPVGFVSLSPLPSNGLKDLGPLEDLERHFDSIDEVLIADPAFPQERAVELVDRCHRHGVRVCVAPSTMEILMERVEFVPGQTLPLFELKPPVFEGVDFFMKRTFDVVASAALGLLLVPFGAVVALAIKLTSRGPVIYLSERAGIGGAPFFCFKFRTMYSDADRRQSELEARNEKGGAIFKIRRDPRVTPIGRFLRRWSIDELPQLLNVLSGDMSLVGPRPLTIRDYHHLAAWHRKRNLVLPGITGLWQVSGRSELDFDELVRLDFLYLERWSVFLDLTILLKTVPAVIRARGAW
ncbi:MAG: sugar transferase [Actinobacteria bacterium]|nr:MAG: sugar transferase [Actinomycetota bacterium]TMM11799.1 MAG: sugar transferase [Actinomycetota bacterium]